jgi:hypothetical protein
MTTCLSAKNPDGKKWAKIVFGGRIMIVDSSNANDGIFC